MKNKNVEIDVKRIIVQEFFDGEADYERRAKRKALFKKEEEFCEKLDNMQIKEFKKLMQIKGDFECEVNEQLIDFCLKFIKAILN